MRAVFSSRCVDNHPLILCRGAIDLAVPVICHPIAMQQRRKCCKIRSDETVSEEVHSGAVKQAGNQRRRVAGTTLTGSSSATAHSLMDGL